MIASTRGILHLIALLCVGAVAAALASQHLFDMPPCAWCVLQRLILLGIALLCWVGVFLGRYHATLPRVAGTLATLFASGGVLAGWYQYSVASKMFSCDLTFADRFMVGSGLDANVPWLFGIYASCMDARVELFGVEYVIWAMGLFLVVALLGVAAALSRRA